MGRFNSKWTVKPITGRMVQLKIHLSDLANEQGTAFAEKLSENIAYGPRGGVHWPMNPHQSSRPGEFPQEQSSNLRSSVGIQEIEGNLNQVRAGFFAELADDPGRLREYLGEIEGFPAGNFTQASRQPLRMTGDSVEAIVAIVEATADWVEKNK